MHYMKFVGRKIRLDTGKPTPRVLLMDFRFYLKLLTKNRNTLTCMRIYETNPIRSLKDAA